MSHFRQVPGLAGIAVIDVPKSTTGFERDTLSGRVVFGPGRLDCLDRELTALGITGAMLIASSGRPLLAERVHDLGSSHISSIWGEVRQHVPVDLVERAAACLESVDGIVCAGGGSTIGLAKALALRSGLPVVAIPTTYSGSEMTPVWGTSDQGAKRTGRDPGVLARTVIYDPELMAGLPPSVEAASALNAFAHCAEALYAPGRDPVTSLIAAEGARRIALSLPAVEMDRLARRTELTMGAYLGGTAFAVSGGSVHHRLCHLLGGRYDLPHAETHAALLPHVLFALAPAIQSALTDLAGVLGVEAADVPGACWDQAEAAGCSTALGAIGLSRRDALEISHDLAAGSDMVSDEQATALLDAAWHGERPAAGGVP